MNLILFKTAVRQRFQKVVSVFHLLRDSPQNRCADTNDCIRSDIRKQSDLHLPVGFVLIFEEDIRKLIGAHTTLSALSGSLQALP